MSRGLAASGEANSVRKHPEWEWDEANLATFRLLGRHLPIIFTVLPVALFVVRILLVSQGDAGVVAALVQNADLTALLISTLLQWAPAVILAGAYTLVITRGLRGVLKVPEPTRILLASTWWTLTLFYLATRPWTVAVCVTAIGAAMAAMWRLWTKRKVKSGINRFTFGLDPAVYLSIFFISLYSPSLWMPLEKVTMSSGSVNVGYVLNKENQDNHLVFVAREGGTRYLDPDEVRKREPCVESKEHTSVLGLLGEGRRTTPQCPK